MAEHLKENESRNPGVAVRGDKAKEIAEERKEAIVEEASGGSVVRNKASIRKKTFGDKIRGEFFEGEVDSIGEHVLNNILIPAIKDTIYNVIDGAISGLFYGNSRGNKYSSSQNRNYTSYSRPSQTRNQYRAQPERGGTRAPVYEYQCEDDALDVLERMNDILGESYFCTLADYIVASGDNPDAYDYAWGWDDLRTAIVKRSRNGYFYIDLPRPIPGRR